MNRIALAIAVLDPIASGLELTQANLTAHFVQPLELGERQNKNPPVYQTRGILCLFSSPLRRLTSVYDLGSPGGHRRFSLPLLGTSPVYCRESC